MSDGRVVGCCCEWRVGCCKSDVCVGMVRIVGRLCSRPDVCSGGSESR